MIETHLEERQMVCDAVQGVHHTRPKDIRRVTVEHLIVEWLIDGIDLRLHFFYFVDSGRFYDEEYLKYLRALKVRDELPTSKLWPFAFGEAVLPIIADHFSLSGPERITMEWIPELVSWDTLVKRICVVTPPSPANITRLATTIHAKLVS